MVYSPIAANRSTPINMVAINAYVGRFGVFSSAGLMGSCDILVGEASSAAEETEADCLILDCSTGIIAGSGLVRDINVTTGRCVFEGESCIPDVDK